MSPLEKTIEEGENQLSTLVYDLVQQGTIEFYWDNTDTCLKDRAKKVFNGVHIERYIRYSFWGTAYKYAIYIFLDTGKKTPTSLEVISNMITIYVPDNTELGKKYAELYQKILRIGSESNLVIKLNNVNKAINLAQQWIR